MLLSITLLAGLVNESQAMLRSNLLAKSIHPALRMRVQVPTKNEVAAKLAAYQTLEMDPQPLRKELEYLYNAAIMNGQNFQFSREAKASLDYFNELSAASTLFTKPIHPNLRMYVTVPTKSEINAKFKAYRTLGMDHRPLGEELEKLYTRALLSLGNNRKSFEFADKMQKAVKQYNELYEKRNTVSNDMQVEPIFS